MQYHLSRNFPGTQKKSTTEDVFEYDVLVGSLISHERAKPRLHLILPGTMKDKIHIVFSLDENYAVQAGVALMSILYHTSEPVRFHFYLLHGKQKLSGPARAKFSRMIKTYGAALDYVEAHGRPLTGLENLSPEHGVRSTYYRLMIPDLLPNLERCLYLDCDVLALGDLAELWDMVNLEIGVAAIGDCYLDRVESKKNEVISRFFNTGVLLMNLRLWRKQGRVKSCLQLLAEPKMHKWYADQDILNVVFRDDVHFLHPRWNIQTGQKPSAKTRERDQEWREILQAPRIAHFTTPSKPGNMGMTHHWSMEYWRMLAKTPWGQEMSDLGKKMLVARLYRLKRVAQKTLRWMLEASLNLKARTCRIALFGRILVDRRSRKATGEFQA
jgi:lipopolysaccharide biosynthesis glycosyltransferase